MIDIPALKARLSDPREVARLLGLRVMQRLRNGVNCACPVHNNKSGALRLRVQRGRLMMNCFGCGIWGDAIDLIVAMEGDYKRGLERAAVLVGGSVAAPVPVYAEQERCDPEVYHALAERILDAGKLDGRSWVRPVEEYLAGRGLLELARGDDWACLPSFEALPGHPDELLAAKLARWDRDGELAASWPGHRLVIPWRGPDGRIRALQRRVIEKAEGPKYVLPWAPEWPYGSERVEQYENIGVSKPVRVLVRPVPVTGGADNVLSSRMHGMVADGRTVGAQVGCCGLRESIHGHVSPATARPVAIVEGAVDTLALRALHPRFAVLGIPGINGWRASWAALAGDAPRIALDCGKPDPNGIVQEDRAAARIALDCAGRGQETDRALEWWLGRHRRGRALGCVLCGKDEAWLCGACGRRRAPEGQDWGEVWRTSLSI